MRVWLSLFLVSWVAGCATAPPLQPVDLSAPDWEVRQGQAVWRPSQEAPELVGDILFATHPGGSLLRFSKTLPIVNARLEGRRWEADFPPRNQRFAGSGKPPKKISWFHLINGLEGRELPENWIFTGSAEGSGVLVNSRTGERIEVHFQP